MGKFSPIRLSGCVTNGEIGGKVVTVTSLFSPTFLVICDKGIVTMGKLGGKVVKGNWALKHSLRSQYLPIAPLVGCDDPNGRNISSLTCDSVFEIFTVRNANLSLNYVYQTNICLLNFDVGGGIFKSTGNYVIAGKNRVTHLASTIKTEF